MAKNNMDQDILKVLFSEQEIHDRIQEMGDQLYDKFHDRNPLFVGVLSGGGYSGLRQYPVLFEGLYAGQGSQ